MKVVASSTADGLRTVTLMLRSGQAFQARSWALIPVAPCPFRPQAESNQVVDQLFHGLTQCLARHRHQPPHHGEPTRDQYRDHPPPRSPGRPGLRIARPQRRGDDRVRDGDLRIRPNRPGPNRTERGLEIDICDSRKSVSELVYPVTGRHHPRGSSRRRSGHPRSISQQTRLPRTSCPLN